MANVGEWDRLGKGRTRRYSETHPVLFEVWRGMCRRCSSPTHISYRNYGGRGITVCEEWAEDFRAFRDWALSHGYEPGLTIDREDNDGPYAPLNCRFMPLRENNMKRFGAALITLWGETKTVEEWGRDKRCPITPRALRYRLKQGWEIERAVTQPAAPGLPPAPKRK